MRIVARKLPPAEEAFREMFIDESRYVWRALQRLGVRERDLQDEVLELFLKVHTKFGEYDASRPVRPWLLAFAVRHASDYRQRRCVRNEVYTHDAAAHLASKPSPGKDPYEVLELRERQAIAMAAIEAIDNPEQREVFVLHEFDELPIPEVAHILGVAEGTAYSRLRAARETFRSAVRKLKVTQEKDRSR